MRTSLPGNQFTWIRRQGHLSVGSSSKCRVSYRVNLIFSLISLYRSLLIVLIRRAPLALPCGEWSERCSFDSFCVMKVRTSNRSGAYAFKFGTAVHSDGKVPQSPSGSAPKICRPFDKECDEAGIGGVISQPFNQHHSLSFLHFPSKSRCETANHCSKFCLQPENGHR